MCQTGKALLIAIVALLLGGFGTASKASETGGEIVIGACLDISGPAASVGRANLLGLQDFAGLVNQEGGVFGKKVKVVSEDSKFNAHPDGISGVERIMAQFHPRLLVVDSSHLMMALLGYKIDETKKKIIKEDVSLVGSGKKYEVLLTSGSMMDDFAQEQIHPSVFVTGPTYGDQVRMLLRYVAREKKGAKVALFYCDDVPFGYLPMRFAAHECSKLNLKLMGEVTAPLNASETDESMKGAVEKIRQWSPDFVLMNGFIGRSIPDFVKGCSKKGVESVFLATALGMHEGTLKMLKSISTGYVYMGVNPYRYWYMEGSMINKLKEYRRRKHQEMHPNEEFSEQKDYQPNYYILGALQGMILLESVKMAYEQSGDKEPTFGQLVEGLRSIKNFPTGGLTDEPLTLKNNSFDVGRIYKADPHRAVFVPMPNTSWGDFFLR